MYYIKRELEDYSTKELAEEIARREREEDREKELEYVLNQIELNKDTARVTEISHDLGGNFSATIEFNRE